MYNKLGYRRLDYTGLLLSYLNSYDLLLDLYASYLLHGVARTRPLRGTTRLYPDTTDLV
jgi:hypothetical protein